MVPVSVERVCNWVGTGEGMNKAAARMTCEERVVYSDSERVQKAGGKEGDTGMSRTSLGLNPHSAGPSER